MMDERISLGHCFRRAVTQQQKDGEGVICSGLFQVCGYQQLLTHAMILQN